MVLFDLYGSFLTYCFCPLRLSITLCVCHKSLYSKLLLFKWKLFKLCMPCVACVTQRRHIGITILRRRRHKIISVTFFSGTTQASFLIFGTEHQYGELYRVWQFRICRMSTSCLTQLRIFFISKHFSLHFSQEPHRSASWYLVQSISKENCIVYDSFESAACPLPD